MLIQLVAALYMVTSGLARFDRVRISWGESGVRIALAAVLLAPYPVAGAFALAGSRLVLGWHCVLLPARQARAAANGTGVTCTYA